MTSDRVDWSDLDRADDPRGFIRCLDAVGRGMEGLRSLVLKWLALCPDEVLLDLGCGTGEATREASDIVGDRGYLVGVDRSATMIAEARRRTTADCPASFLVADAHDLPFPHERFDACRVERTLQHVADPARAVSEMVRTLRRGGRLVAFEPDWYAMIIDHPDHALTSAIRDVVAEGIRHGRAGRQLLGLMSRAGLREVQQACVGVANGFVWFRASRAIARAVDHGRLDRAAVEGWLRDGEDAEREGRFLAVTPVFIVSGRR